MNMNLFKKIKSVYVKQAKNCRSLTKTVQFTNEQSDLYEKAKTNNPILGKLSDSWKMKSDHNSELTNKTDSTSNDFKNVHSFTNKVSYSCVINKDSTKTLMDTNSNSTTNKSYFEGNSNSPFHKIERSSSRASAEITSTNKNNSCVLIHPFNNKTSGHVVNLSPRKKIPAKKKSKLVNSILVNSNKNNSDCVLQISPLKEQNMRTNSLPDISGLLPKHTDPAHRRISFFGEDFDINTIINFEYLKSFTTLQLKDIELIEEIHHADICKVYKGKYLSLPVAVKIYNIKLLQDEDLKCFNSEVNLLMSLRHPGIVTFLGTCTTETNFLLVYEYLDRKSLKHVLEDKNIKLSLKQRVQICFDISVAIYYLHTRNPQVLHRDLKSSNVLIDSSFKVKLCDFGLSKTYEHFTQMATNSTSTPCWMAPEFLIDNIFIDKSDIYSFGILIWEIMMNDTVPYKGKNEFDFYLADKESLKKRPLIQADFNPEIKSVITSCWHCDYKQRPNISQVTKTLEDLLTRLK